MVAWLHKWRIPILSTIGFAFVLTEATVTGYISWGHIVHVGNMVQEPSADLLPVAVDGMMVTGAIMAWIDRLRGYAPRFWSYVALWLGSVMTLGFNVLSALERGIYAMLLAMVPAVAFLVTVEAVFHPSQRLLEMSRRALKQRAAMHQAAVEQAQATMAAQPAVAPTTEVPAGPVADAPSTQPDTVDVAVNDAKPPRRSAPRTSAKVPAGVKPVKRAKVRDTEPVSVREGAPLVADMPLVPTVPNGLFVPPVPVATGDEVAEPAGLVYAHGVSMEGAS